MGELDYFGIANRVGAVREASPPVLQGAWGKPEALVFMGHLERGALSDALEVIGALRNDGARAVLLQAGFAPQLTGGRHSMLESVQSDVVEAAQKRVTGVALRATAAVPAVVEEKVFPGAIAAPSFAQALQLIQSVLSAADVEVGLAGSASLDARASLQFIAVQAIERGVSGFAIEGVRGKYALPDSVDLAGLRALHTVAGGAFAEAEVRATLPGWANGKGVARLSDLVPESVARLLRGSPTLEGAEAIQKALLGGEVRTFGAQHGVQQTGQVLLGQGVRIDAPTIEQMVEDAGLKLKDLDYQRGAYVGPIVVQDHRASVVKCSRDEAIILAHRDIPHGVNKPEKGDMVRLKYSGGALGVVVQQKGQGLGVGR